MEQTSNSATFSITTAGGFNVLFTVRDTDIKKAKELYALVEALDRAFTEKGIKPQVKSAGGFPKKEKNFTGDVCPKDGGRIYYEKTKGGKDICKCENSKYDFTTKTTSGCDFVAWGKNLKDAEEQKRKWLDEKAKVDNFNSEYGQA